MASSGADREALICSYVNDPRSNLTVAATVALLSTHAADEQCLDTPNALITVREPGFWGCPRARLNPDLPTAVQHASVSPQAATRRRRRCRGHPTTRSQTRSLSRPPYTTQNNPTPAGQAGM